MKKLLAMLMAVCVLACSVAIVPETVLAEEAGVREKCGDFTYIVLADGSAEIVGYPDRGDETAVNIPNELDGIKVTSIGKLAFSACSQLRTITIPEGVTKINEGAFASCSGLESITIPEGVTGIGSLAFSECSSLKSVILPESMTNMEIGLAYAAA